MSDALSGKLILVTGAAQGLGRATALTLAKRGARLVLIDLNEDKLDSVANECAQLSEPPIVQITNVAREGEVRALFAALEEPLFGLVNNAGITRDALLVKKRDGELSSMSLAEWQAVIDVNLTGVFLCGREAALHMLTHEQGGVIVNLSSVSKAGNIGQSNYSAAKAGVAAMSVTWARELSRYNIRCAAVAPGVINTDMVASMKPEARDKIAQGIPLKRLGNPEHIAETIAFIFENDYITGRVFEVDGGLRM